MDNIKKPAKSPDCLLGEVPQPTDSRLSVTTFGISFQVTLSMSYSSSVTSHNSRVVTDDILRLHGRKEHLTREKALKVEQRLAVQRMRRQNLACARSTEMQRVARQGEHDPQTTHSAGLSAPRLLACDLASARLDRIRARTNAMTHANTNAHTYLSLNKDC